MSMHSEQKQRASLWRLSAVGELLRQLRSRRECLTSGDDKRWKLTAREDVSERWYFETRFGEWPMSRWNDDVDEGRPRLVGERTSWRAV